MSAETFFNYAVLVAALWVVAEGALLSIWKPFVLHPLRDALLWTAKPSETVPGAVEWTYKSALHEKAYTLLSLGFLAFSGALTIAPAVSAFDAFSIFNGGAAYTLPFGLGFSYWYGAILTDLVMVAGGELIHDFLASRDLMPDVGDVLPPGVGE